jgi:aminopeptidase N
MRDFNAVLGPDYQVESRVVEGITVNSVFYPGHHQGGEWALDCTAEAVCLFSIRFGPYPFAELDVVETPTHAGGIEYPGLVVINDTYYETLSERMEWVVVHEVAHQWWYSLVGNDQVDEPWLDEALVQYSTLLYYEDRYGAELAAELLEQVFRQPYEALVETGRDAPAGLPVAAYSEGDYGPVVYQKGPLYFHALRQEVGDENFWAILQTYFARNRYGVATPEDWLAAVAAVTGDEHHALYEQWIMGAAEQ